MQAAPKISQFQTFQSILGVVRVLHLMRKFHVVVVRGG